MQFFVSVIDNHTGSGTPEEMAAIGVFNERLKAEGHLVFAAGLGGPGSAKVIDNRRDGALVTDGPFAETNEWIAGFWIWNAASLDDALELAVAGSKACNRRLEVRPLLQGPRTDFRT